MQPQFTKSTKFNDLPDATRKMFEEIEYVTSLYTDPLKEH